MSGEKIDGKNINFNKDFPQFPAGENQQKVEKEMSFIPLVKETPEEEYRQKILDYSYGEEKDPLAEWQENQKKEKSKWHQYQEGWKKSFKGVGEAEGVVGKTAAVAKAVAGRTHEGFESLDHINPLYYAKMPFKSFSEYIDKVVDDGNPEKIALAETIWNTIKKGGNVLDYATSSEGIEMILACYALGAVEGVDAAANGIKTVLQSAKAKNIGLTATAAILASCDTADNYKTDIVEYGPKEGKTEITTNITINNRINVAINGAAAQSDPELKATLTAILKAIEDGNKLDKNNGDILDKILKKLESIDDRVKNLEGGVAALTANDEVKIDLLTQILTKIGNLEEGQKDMSAAAKTFYDTLLAKLDNMSAAQADFFTAVLSKLDNMSDAQANFYTALLAKMDNTCTCHCRHCS